MANIKITDLTAYTDPLNTDVLPIVDVTSDTTKKVSIADLLKNASAGTAAAPSIAFDGDPNTGIYSPGADQLAISTGGTGRLFVDSSGRVGIGGTSDFAEFQIAGSAPSLYLKPAADTETSEVAFRNAANSQTRGFVLYNHSDESLQFRVNLSERLRITSDGKLGLGISSPSTRLHVVGPNANGNFGVVETTGMFSAGGNQQLRLCVDETNKASALQSTESGVANRALLLNPAGGNVGIGTAIPSQKLDVSGVIRTNTGAQAGVVYLGADSYGVIQKSSSEFRVWSRQAIPITFLVADAERARIDSSGRLGLGTSSPSKNLEIAATTPVIRAVSTQNLGTWPVNTEIGGIEFYSNDPSASGPHIASFIRSVNDTNAGLQPDGALTFGTAQYNTGDAVERLRISHTGNVGIGTASPGYLLHLANNGTLALQLEDTSTSTRYRIENTSGDLSFVESGVGERMRIDSSGRLLVGTSTARTNFFNLATTVAPNLQLEGSGDLRRFSITCCDANGSGSQVILAHQRSGTVGGNTVLIADDEIGSIRFQGSDGSELVEAASIKAEVDGTPGANDMPGRLVFFTTADSASSPTERMRISANGRFNCQGIYSFTTASAANVFVASDGNVVRSTSSSKYKTQVEAADYHYSEALLGCEPVWYRSTCAGDNPEWGWWGFIAEDVAKIDPRLVHWKTVQVTHDENGAAVQSPCDPEPEGVAYDRFVPHLLNLIKRQKEQIETMEARLSALEAS